MLGIAVSFDGFAAGFAFGLKKLRVPPLSLFIICGFSTAFVFISMQAGSLVSGLFSPVTASFIGGIILTFVGVFIIRQALEDKRETASGQNSERGKKAKCSPLSVVLQDPLLADSDNSGAISAGEAILLGVTLALDALAAGFGAAMMGISPAAASLAVAVSKFVFVSAGLYLGKRYADDSREMRAAAFSGLVFVILGLSHLSHSFLSL
jgi:putative sporulation protein YtaF